MNDIIKNENIESLIYEIRDKQVMLDSDLARLYECANGTKTINLAVKRHINKFPERYMFQLTKEEFEYICGFNLKPQNNKIRSLPYAFTEQGVAMLATILRTKVADEVSMHIIDAFVAIRKYISSNLISQQIINNQVIQNTNDIKLLKESFKILESKKKEDAIFFDGQIFDAYSKIYEIFTLAQDSLIIIDSYADITLLDIIKKLNINVTIITKQNCHLTNQDIEKYNEQYNNLNVIYNDTFHDRYFILDNKIIYHCGASINRIGYKTFSISLMNDESICSLLLDRLNDII